MSFSKLSIVIACYNESATLREIVRRVQDADTLGLDREIITDISQIAFKSMAIIPKLRRRRNGFPSAAVR